MNANQWEMLTAPECWLMAAAFIVAIALNFYKVGGKSRLSEIRKLALCRSRHYSLDRIPLAYWAVRRCLKFHRVCGQGPENHVARGS